MKYYTLTYESGNDSVFPQVDLVSQNHGLDSEHIPEIDSLKMRLCDGATFSSVLSQAGINSYGFLMNNEVKDLFVNLATCNVSFVPVYVEADDNTEKYWWMHLYQDVSYLENIDFKNSKFQVKKFSKLIGEIELESYHDYLEKKKELGVLKRIRPKVLVLKGTPMVLDVFILPRISPSVIVTEKAKKVLEIIPGFVFKDIEIFPTN